MPASLVWQRGNTMEFHYIDSKQHIRVIYGLRYDNTNGEEVNNKLSWQAKNYFKGILDVIPTDDIEEDTEIKSIENIEEDMKKLEKDFEVSYENINDNK